MKEAFAIIAALMAIVGNVPYVKDVLDKKVQPHAYTWFVWSLVSGIIFFGQLAKGAGIGALPTFASEIFTVIIFLLSLRYGFKKITLTDTFFLLVALIGVGFWIFTDDPTISVIIAVGIDLVAFIPTILKTWTYPRTETPLLYSMNVTRHALALFSLQAYNIATTLHSIAMITTNTIMTLIMLFHKGKPDGKDGREHPVP
jgi:hypothetical protein